MQYASYKIDGSKANEFRTAAVALFGNDILKKELQARMINMDRATMSFELDVRGDCPVEITDLAVRFGAPQHSYE